MDALRYKGPLEPLIKWATNRGRSAKTPAEPPEPYRSWVRDQMPPNCRNVIGYWVGVITPDSELDGDWVKGYPHIHAITMGWEPSTTTVMTYLTAPTKGGEFALGTSKESDPYTLIKVTPGLTVKCDAVTWHGVKPVLEGTRIALITTGCPD